jgi:hypothetical protein
VPTPFDELENRNTSTDRHSTFYRIKVTDKNGIVAWSPDYKLIQPAQLIVSFNTSQLLCNGDTNGTSTALPNGGTVPYKYSWSTDDKTNSVSNLTDGFYSVIVTDTRGCTTFAQTEVKVPNGLAVEATVKQPTCNNFADGSVLLTTTGGKKDYSYQWKHGPQTEEAKNLGQGTYSVTITDANGCFLNRDYTLDNPALLPVYLGPDRVLCKDQTLEINGAVADPASTYSWSRSGAPFSKSAVAVLTDAGTYTLQVTDSKGCTNQDEVTITRNETEIAADFVVATRLPKDERVRITNISYPSPDKMEWIIPAGVSVESQQPEYLELVFDRYGDYVIGLRSFKGACEKTVQKTVRVVPKSELADYKAPDEPFIKRFMVFSNPNNGRFTVSVELREVSDYKLILYSSQGTPVSEKSIKGQALSDTDFDVTGSVSSGVYVLQLITKQGVATFKVIVR